MAFVRKLFYVPVPKNNNPDDWEAWIKADDAKAKADKTAHTCKQEHTDIPDAFLSTHPVKIDGVWKQTISVGLDGDLPVLIQPSTQDRCFQARGFRGGSASNKRKNRRNKRREAKRQRLLGK